MHTMGSVHIYAHMMYACLIIFVVTFIDHTGLATSKSHVHTTAMCLVISIQAREVHIGVIFIVSFYKSEIGVLRVRPISPIFSLLHFISRRSVFGECDNHYCALL